MEFVPIQSGKRNVKIFLHNLDTQNPWNTLSSTGAVNCLRGTAICAVSKL
jgi:hypothetical protein